MFRNNEDIFKGLKTLGYEDIETALRNEYSKIGPVALAKILKVHRYSVTRWMRLLGLPRSWKNPKAKVFEGKPCPKGHTLRYLSNKGCVKCISNWNAECRRRMTNDC